jgi:hypothetical protein
MVAPAVVGGHGLKPRQRPIGLRGVCSALAGQILLDPLVVQLATASLATWIVAVGRAAMRSPMDPLIDGTVWACNFLAVACIALRVLRRSYGDLRKTVLGMRNLSASSQVSRRVDLPRLASVAPVIALPSSDGTSGDGNRAAAADPHHPLD